MIPFLVVDRPASLRIIKGANLNGKIGLMSHANTTPLFRKLFKSYPCGEELCHAIDPSGETKCKVDFDASKCDVAQIIRQKTIKICDCGMFTKAGIQYTYPELFKIYDDMGADFGIMLDVFRDRDATIASARSAIEIYDQQEHNFKLVLVAQGNDADEYLSCYDTLKQLGGEYIAIGGLLQRIENTVRYVQVRSEKDMQEILKGVREKFDPEWLFALGCYHPKRHEIFQELGVWGSDYKGWIFQYDKRERLIQNIWESISHKFVANELTSYQSIIKLDTLIQERAELVKQLEKEAHKKSERNTPFVIRSNVIIEMDNSIGRQLELIKRRVPMNGTSRFVERKTKEILALSQETERQLRYKQVRAILNNLVLKQGI